MSCWRRLTQYGKLRPTKNINPQIRQIGQIEEERGRNPHAKIARNAMDAERIFFAFLAFLAILA